MPLLIVLMAAMIAVVVAYFWHLSPRGVSRTKVFAANLLVLAGALALAFLAGYFLYSSGAHEVERRDMLVSLAVIGGGMAFLAVVLVGGVIRNLVLFPRSRRAPEPPG